MNMEKAMNSTHLETPTQNKQSKLNHTNTQLLSSKEDLVRTLLLSSKDRTQINLSRQQLDSFIWLYRQYDIKKPGWLRCKFRINRLRKSELNRVLVEAGVDNRYCSNDSFSFDRFDYLHLAWHQINGRSLC